MNSKSSLGILVALLVMLFISLSGFLLIAGANSVKHRDLVPKYIATKEELVMEPEHLAEIDKMAEFQNEQELASDKSEFNHLANQTITNQNDSSLESRVIPDEEIMQSNIPVEKTNNIKSADNSNNIRNKNNNDSIHNKNNTDIADSKNSTDSTLKRTVIANYSISSGDTVSSVARNYWGNPYLWPDLYVNNEWISKNPDLIYPLEKVRILNKLGRGSSYTEQEILAINNAYLEVYGLYNDIGARANPSKWYTLYSATQIIPDFFERNQGIISEQDVAMAKKQAKESQVFSE